MRNLKDIILERLVLSKERKTIAGVGNIDFKLECSVKDNTIRIKCKPDYLLIGKTFNLIARTKHSSKMLIVEVASL